MIRDKDSVAYLLAEKLANLHKNGATMEELNRIFQSESKGFPFWIKVAIGDTFKELTHAG